MEKNRHRESLCPLGLTRIKRMIYTKKKNKKKKIEAIEWKRVEYLVDHFVLEDGGTVENLHGDALASFSVLSELDLREGSFTNGPSNLILAHFPQHHAFSSSLFDFCVLFCSSLFPISSNNNHTAKACHSSSFTNY